MDGAIILGSPTASASPAPTCTSCPIPTVPTSETGTRHRTAERVARSHPRAGGQRQRGDGRHHRLRRRDEAPAAGHRPAASTAPTRRCRRSSATRSRLDDTLGQPHRARARRTWPPSATWPSVVQRGEMVRRISAEIETMIVELGVDARLLRLQVDEVYGEINHELELVLADYPLIANNWAGHGLHGDSPASPRGLRLLTRVPRITPAAGRRNRRALRRPGQAATGDGRRDRRGRRRRRHAGHRRQGNARSHHRDEHPRPVR